MDKYFDCPKCGSKKSAVRSSYYPQIIVHKCDGKTLQEVGAWSQSGITPVNIAPSKVSSQQLRTRNFVIEKITDYQILMKHGDVLNNATKIAKDAQNFLKQGDVWVVKKQNFSSSTTVYMILVENGTIQAPHFFSGKDITPIPKQDGEEILRELINSNILRRNPFPNTYTV